MNLEGFILPPEWAPHEATWLSWPVNQETWPKNILKEALPQYLQFIAELSQVEKVRVNIAKNQHEVVFSSLDKELGVNIENIQLYDHSTNDCWCRDHGPDFLIKNSEKIILNWQYNSWGEKYPPYDLDNGIPNKVAQSLGLDRLDIPMVLEGGSFDINGNGVLMTTKSCLLKENRNPQYSPNQIENYLKEYLRQNEVIWLEEGIRGDDTDGHIDDISRFVNKETIITSVCEQENLNYETLENNKKVLADSLGDRFEIIDLLMPKPLFFSGNEVPASYANFYIANDIVIVPIFNDSNDNEALDILKECFPERNIVGVDSSKIIYGLGSFHCLSKQEPKV